MTTSAGRTMAATLRRVAHACDRPLRVVASGNAAVPWELLRLLDDSVECFELFMLNAPHGIPTRSGVTHVTPFVGPGMRHASVSYLPARLSHVPTLLARRFVPDVVLVSVSEPMGRRWSLGSEVNILPAAMSVCRAAGGLVLAESRADVPFTYGDGELDAHDLDEVLAASTGEPHRVTAPPANSAAINTIGERVAARVGSGATLQLGIGAIPDSTVPRLTGRRNLGVWSEMVSDGILDLDDAGALDSGRQVVASFAVGGPRLMSWLHGNPRVRMLRTETVNDPGRIASQPAMTSINTALSVDLFDQANGSHIGSRVHSGFGGQCDFVVGAMDSPGGQALMALRSWHPRADLSTIVGLLEGPVTSFQHTAVITENGTADIMGWDTRAQARHLIEQAAHPSVRTDLWEDARELGLA
ncbi:MAG: acetyl-CoA hydrolase/transferase C-terminal domain-containing protein [Knoellia sp.]